MKENLGPIFSKYTSADGKKNGITHDDREEKELFYTI